MTSIKFYKNITSNLNLKYFFVQKNVTGNLTKTLNLSGENSLSRVPLPGAHC